MTTIACDGWSMAGDGQVHRHDMIVMIDAVKVRRLEDGTLMGSCGTAGPEKAIEQWWLSGAKGKCEQASDTNALFLTKAGKIFFLGDCGYLDEHAQPTAIGSGSPYALAILANGKSAEEAVTVAASLDPHTGGKITVLRLNDRG